MKKIIVILMFIGICITTVFSFEIENEYSNEMKELQKFSKYVKRDNQKLIISLKNKTEKEFISNNGIDDNGGIWYFFRGYLKEIGYYVIEELLDEGANVILINEKTGAEYRNDVYYNINEISISPNKKWIIFNNNDEANYTLNGLIIWEIEKEQLKKVFEKESKIICNSSKNVYLKFLKWDTDNDIELKKLDENYKAIDTIKLQYKNKRWQLKK